MDANRESIELNVKGIAQFEKNQLKEAIASYREALTHDPTADYTYNNLGLALYCYGLLEEAVDCCKTALAHDPNNLSALNNLLYYINYRDFDAETVFNHHLEYARRTAQEFQPDSFENTPQPDRLLRIGYVSPDFRGHAVAYFIEPVLKSHDRDRFRIYCYANVASPDIHTERFQDLSDRWRNIHGVPDEEVRELIRDDEIDILVDLAGHTHQNRLSLFSQRSAPIQMTWLGYFNTTGLSTIDYLISDAVSSPEGDKQPFAEKLLRMPNVRLCYQPPDYAPPAASLPSLKNPFTFGCFNNSAKISEEALNLWARILQAMPESRLLLKSAGFGNADIQKRYFRFFEERGIAPERILLRGQSPHFDMLQEYGEVDIALDTFPFTGGLTTCEALWQGVPVLTLSGKTLISRQSASFLSALGLTDWIAHSPEEYESKAISLAGDLSSLLILRGSLRDRMQGSPICDRISFTLRLEELYRQAWQDWCGVETIEAENATLRAENAELKKRLGIDTARERM